MYTCTNHHHRGDMLQLNYGGVAAGCQVTVLIDQLQRLADWASSGTHYFRTKADEEPSVIISPTADSERD
ncbi:hypothetical protein JAB6_39270 [Janthinobacterium sp. HH104]|uniref:hypothetical protein n=1 Tax=unclassified Janthinobacterium TaxID=2610881 RepID=UPI000892F173|nr:hypothetical protein [Janthinobacterium sp. HH104]OEZ81663.1 hypothetical protein JAB6_39270 [Janthinobacterium sp. HH104]